MLLHLKTVLKSTLLPWLMSRWDYVRFQTLPHTCGLPDQLPGNVKLRAAHADLPEFLVQIAENGTDYTPGADCRYSSMGYLLLGEIMSRSIGQPLPALLHSQLFAPVG